MVRLRRVGAVICAVLAPLSSGCVRTHVGALASTPAAGPLPGATLSVGGRGYELVRCASGDRESFLGVDLADRADQAILRLVVDPVDGPRLKVVVAGAGPRRSLALESSSCRRLQAQVEPTAWRVNRVRDLSGFVDADCTSDTGIDVLARVRFTHCH